MVDRLKMYINKLIADGTKYPEYALDKRGQAYGALMFILEDTTLSDKEKQDLFDFWDGAWTVFNDLYTNYVKGNI